jgi:uncharacterized cupredoxin-like copper-binding protein
MSRRPRQRGIRGPLAMVRLFALSCAVLALLAGGFAQSATVRAQDATPEAAGPCVAPELPPGTPTPQEASPEAGTPVAEPALEPEVEASPEAGTPADEATAAAAAEGAQNIVNCLNSGNYTGTAALFTPNMIMQIAGTDNPYDAVANLEGTVFTDFQTGEVLTYADGRLSIEVSYFQSQYQYVQELWWLVQDGEFWKLDGFGYLTPEPEGDTAVVGVALGTPENEYSIVPNATSVTETEVLIFHATNGGQELHELAVLQLPEGADPAGLLDGSIPEDQITFIGAVDNIAPGEAKDLALVGLPPGVYTLLCFYPAPDGRSHAEHGMVASFEVTAATT